MSDTQESTSDENAKKIFLRSQNSWKIGEKFPVSFVPTVEGMVVATRWIDNNLMVVFLSPPYTRDEGTWAEAALMYKPAASLVKKALSIYDFPFPTDPRILEEVKKANGNLEVLQEVAKFLNKKLPPPQSLQENQKSSALTKQNWDVEEPDGGQTERLASDRLSLQLLLSQQGDDEQPSTVDHSDKLIDRLAQVVSQRLSVKSEKDKNSGKKKKKKCKKRAKKRDKSPSSSSSSKSSQSSSDSESSSSDENVGNSEDEEGKGWCVCPFSVEDVRGTAAPRQKMQGKKEERIMLRKALHNIYSEYQTLKTYVETVRTESLSSSAKLYNSDLLWLSYHASYLDLLLLYAVDGPWHSWNELVVDSLTKSFLELLVRSSHNRVYPEILDEGVRKWMKKKRVSISAHFGPIPNFLINAKITDSGIHPKGGWDLRNVRFDRSSASSSNSFKTKTQNAGTDKKS